MPLAQITAPKSKTPIVRVSPISASGKTEWKSAFALVCIGAVTAIYTAWLAVAASHVEIAFLNNHGFFFDPAAYYLRSIEAYRYWIAEGGFGTLVHEVLTNDRCPARIIPYLIFGPKILPTLMGHLWTEVPLLWAFLSLFAATIHQRTKSLFFALAATSLFAGLPFLYSGKLGVGAYWLDFTAACALGCTALCMIRYVMTKNNGWMFAFGAFASLTALCRWSAACYLIMFVALALPAVIGANGLRNWKTTGTSLLCAATTALPGLVFFALFYSSNIAYYKSVAYAFDAPISNSIAWTAHALSCTFGEPLLTLLGWLTFTNLIYWARKDRCVTFIACWFPVAVAIFLCGIAKAIDGFHPIVYFAPALFAAAFLPIGEIRGKHVLWNAFGVTLIAIAVASGVRSYNMFLHEANNPPPDVKLQKQADQAIAKLIVATNARAFAQFDAETVMPHLESFFNLGKYCQWDTTIFSVHDSYFTRLYPGLLVFAAAVVTAFLWVTTAKLEQTFLDHYGFFYDPAAYYVRNLTVYRYFEQHGLWNSLIYEFFNDERCPGRMVPYLLLQPKLLLSTTGHMWTEMPLVWAFLSLLSTTIFQRTRSFVLAGASIFLFAGLPFLFDPKLGIGAYWLDFPAACALGCAALCAIRYLATRNNGWMFALGAFASATALCRWSAACYLVLFVALAVPALAIANGRERWKKTAASFACAATTALPGIVFFLQFYAYNSWYYKQFGYAFDHPISKSIEWTFKAMQQLFSIPILSILILLTAVNAVLLIKNKNDRILRFVAFWAPAAVFVFLCCIAKAVDGYHPVLFFVPALFISAFCGLGQVAARYRRWCYIAAAIIAVTGIASSINTYEACRRLAKSPPPQIALQKQADASIAKYIVATSSESFTQLDSESCMPHMEVIFNHGRDCKMENVFSTHETYLKHHYKNITAEQMARQAYAKVQTLIELVGVFADPNQATRPGIFDNAYSTTISKYVAERVARDPAFKFVANVDSPQGKLALYQNMSYKKTNPGAPSRE